MAEKPGTEALVRDGESGWEDPIAPPEETETQVSEAFESSQSDFTASEETHKLSGRKGTKGGRPVVPPEELVGIPDPKARIFKSDATNQHQRTKSFYNYWNALPEWAKQNTILYVYRDYPVLTYIPRESTNPENKDQEFNYIDKISGAEPLQDDADLLSRYGCGNYKMKFNAIVPGKPNRTLCTVYAVNIGGGDFKSNPPTDRRISDSKNVDLNNPSNASYVAFLRGTGSLPSQRDAIREESEMATVEVLKDQQKTTERLLDAVLADKKDKTPQDPGFMEKAVSGALKVVEEGSRAAIQITRDANEYANKVREKVDNQTAAAPAQDPLALALQLVELIKGGSGSQDAEVVALRAQIDKMRDDQISMFREELKSLREKPVSHSENPFNNIEAGLTAIKKMREMTEEISGGNDKGSVAEEVADAAGAPKWLVRFSPLIQQGLSIVDGFIRMRSGQMQQPPMPGQYPQAPGGYPPPGWNGPGPVQNPSQQFRPPQANINGPQLVQQRHPLGTLDPSQFTPELTQLLQSIAVPIQVHLGEGDTGTAFAEWFMTGFGDDTHAQVVQFGPEAVVAALYSFPPTLQAIQQFPVEQIQIFIAEFLNPQFPPQPEGEEGNEEDNEDLATATVKTPA